MPVPTEHYYVFEQARALVAQMVEDQELQADIIAAVQALNPPPDVLIEVIPTIPDDPEV